MAVKLINNIQQLNRKILAGIFGKQYSGDRDLFKALGYPTEIAFLDYWVLYKRHDIANAVINKPIEKTWSGDFHVEDTNVEDSEFEKGFSELYKNLHIKAYFERIDKLTAIGTYGILFLGFNDITTSVELQNEVVKSNILQLIYLKPYAQNVIDIHSYEKDPKSPRYGLPLLYRITMHSTMSDKQSDVLVHYSRVLHITGELLDNDIEGTPTLEPIYNRLMDLQKLMGGSAEMYWRGARPGYQSKVDDDYDLDASWDDDIRKQLDEYEHNLRRVLTLEGVKLESLSSQVSDPSNHVDVQLQMISSQTGIPKRILMGSERGELSSAQDHVEYLEMIQQRREQIAEMQFVRALIDRLIDMGILPVPPSKQYKVQWSDLFAMSAKEKVEIGKSRSTALKEYVSNPAAESIVPPEEFFIRFLAFTKSQAAGIIQATNSQILKDNTVV